MTPELQKTEADNCDAQSGLSPAPLLGGCVKCGEATIPSVDENINRVMKACGWCEKCTKNAALSLTLEMSTPRRSLQSMKIISIATGEPLKRAMWFLCSSCGIMHIADEPEVMANGGKSYCGQCCLAAAGKILKQGQVPEMTAGESRQCPAEIGCGRAYPRSSLSQPPNDGAEARDLSYQNHLVPCPECARRERNSK